MSSDTVALSPSPASVRLLERRWTARRVGEWAIQGLLFLCAFASILTTTGILYMLASETIYSPNSDDPAFLQRVSLRQVFGDSVWSPNFVPSILESGLSSAARS